MPFFAGFAKFLLDNEKAATKLRQIKLIRTLRYISFSGRIEGSGIADVARRRMMQHYFWPKMQHPEWRCQKNKRSSTFSKLS
jgi:hypothetical protein